MFSILKYIFQSKQLSTRHRYSKVLSYYSQPETAMSEIHNHLLQFKGGSIHLAKDENTGIATLCLNHPEKRNAISGKMMVDLADAIEVLENWDLAKGLIVYGSGNTFCSGGDLDFARQTSNPDDGFKMSHFMQNVLGRLQKLPIITVALIEGAGALGGGAELAIACDFRLLASNAVGVGFVHARMGIVTAWGGGSRLIQTIGPRRALDLMSTSRIVPPQEALNMGLVDGIVCSENSLLEAIDWLSVRIKPATEVVRALKAIVNNSRELQIEDALAEERRIFAPLWGGKANKQALQKNIKHKILPG